MTETIYALSSGAPPAAIAIVRISGPRAEAALEALTGTLPEPRRATIAPIRCGDEEIDRALVLRFPGPQSATGEDVAELHVHGGRAVVAAVLRALGELEGLREAQAGEFTRRAFDNGRIDLAEAEGLADLLTAETEGQRRAAFAMAGGALSRQAEAWRRAILSLAAEIEAELDFGDEDDVAASLAPSSLSQRAADIAGEMEAMLARPPVERLRDGIRVAIAGPPNSGKSSLFNVLCEREAAITSSLAGTTRDLIEAPVAIGGTAFVLIDTAGLRATPDAIEGIGVERALAAVDAADLVLWLGEPGQAPPRAVRVHAKCDLGEAAHGTDIEVSAVTGAGINALSLLLVERTRDLLPHQGDVALNERHRAVIAECTDWMREAARSRDHLVTAEALRQARAALDRLTGRAGVEDMLDSLFGRFCIGK